MDNRFGTLTVAAVFGLMAILAVFAAGGCGTSNTANRDGRKQDETAYGNPAETTSFYSARPIWPEGRETEMNLFVGFRAVFNRPRSGAAVLRITGSSLYRIFLNGTFLVHGPARGPHGYWRVDEWPLNLADGENLLAIEVAGYNVNSYYLLDQPAFIQA
ncbi:MAG: hypothetical protein ACYTBJ_01395, partial [Planctomycetota bacterium]